RRRRQVQARRDPRRAGPAAGPGHLRRFAESWPSREDEFADKFNSMSKYVVSATVANPEWNNTTGLTGSPVAAVAGLKRQLAGNIVVHGSARLAQTLLEHDLVDELRLMLFPVLLGAGKGLFGELADKKRWRPASSRTADADGTVRIWQ